MFHMVEFDNGGMNKVTLLPSGNWLVLYPQCDENDKWTGGYDHLEFSSLRDAKEFCKLEGAKWYTHRRVTPYKNTVWDVRKQNANEQD